MARAASTQAPQVVGVIGAGQIGSAVCKGLLKAGHTVRVHDPSTRNADFLTGLGAQWSEAPAHAADGAEVLFTALPAPPHVRNVMEGGDDGDGHNVLEMLPSGTTWIDHTTTDHHEVRRLSAKAEARGVTMLEAPLTGGLELLRAGMMTVLVGGDKAALDAHKHLFDAYANTVLHMGGVGTASIVKIVTNQLAAVHTVVTGEALMICKRHNVDMQAAFDGIRASAGNSFVFETEAPLMFNGTYDPGFTLELHCKDLNLGRQLAIEGEMPLEVMSLVEQIYRRAMHKYGKDAGSSHPAKLTPDDIGDTVYTPGYENWTYTIEKVTGGGIGVVHKRDGESTDE